jgi:putative hemolysin
MSIALQLVILSALIFVNGLLALSELAIVSARRLRLQHRAEEGDAGAAAALALANEPNRFLSTVQIGITLVGILAGAFGGATLAEKLASWLEDQGLSERYSRARPSSSLCSPSRISPWWSGSWCPSASLCSIPKRSRAPSPGPCGRSPAAAPIVALLSVSTDAVLRLLRVGNAGDSAITEEEIRLLLEQSTEAGVIDPKEQAMASAVLRLGDRNAGDVMTPRPELVWIDRDAAPGQIRDIVVERPHGRYPVGEHDIDRVVGVVALKDLVAQIGKGIDADVRSILRPALFIPESLGALETLERIRQAREPWPSWWTSTAARPAS